MAAVLAVLAAAVPVTRERLTRFAAMTGLSVTETNAGQVVSHFTGSRRWRLAAVVAAVPLAGLTQDVFYLVVGWCAVDVLRGSRRPAGTSQVNDDAAAYRAAWLLALTGAVAASGFLLISQGPTPARYVHAAVLILVAAAVSYASRRSSVIPASEPADDAGRAEPAIGRWSARNRYLAGSAIVLSGAFLAPWQSPRSELPEYSLPATSSPEPAAITKFDGYKGPTCPWFDEIDDPCRWWSVNGQPFPQAAPYVVGRNGAPRRAPFTRSPDKNAVVYLDRLSRRMVHQDAAGVHPLTGRLADTAVPTPTFAGQSRYVALAKDDAQVTDTTTWTTVSIPGARKVHDLNLRGVVVTTASELLVLDHRGQKRISLPLARVQDSSDDTYHLRPDGRRLVAVHVYEGSVETYDSETGERLSRVRPAFRGGDDLDAGLGWSERGAFRVRGSPSDRVYNVDLATGKLWRGERP
ncbi:hypothetical protein [Nonomuraea sp. NPDC050691]|uniref:hypothetical protein n=1 Tax=Nonomuraea sp. NPDC050691 TaxID=3155661 RepID=UPI0033DAD456